MNRLSALRRKFEDDAVWQTIFHKRMTYFWMLNMVAATVVFFVAPGIWANASILYLVLVSLYANMATDYGAVSAAEASTEAHALTAH